MSLTAILAFTFTIEGKSKPNPEGETSQRVLHSTIPTGSVRTTSDLGGGLCASGRDWKHFDSTGTLQAKKKTWDRIHKS